MENKVNGMQTVKHKIFGIGEVISREDKENGTSVTVKFKNGKELRLAIPESFMVDVVVAEGSLKDEVDAAIAEREARKKEHWERVTAELAAAHSTTPSVGRGRRPATPVASKGDIETDFEIYLANAGYREYTASGNPSTVFSYSHAIKRVLDEEGISWHTLKSRIDNIVHDYDIGGSKYHIGAMSNFTVINALKRFREFINA